MTPRARILEATPANLAEAATELRRGKIVAIPTETVYGLAGNAFDPSALARIFDAKERPTFDPLIVHVAPACRTLEDLARLGLIQPEALAPALAEAARRLVARFWPGPLTLVFPKQPRVPDLATSGLATVAVRMPAHPAAQALLGELEFPLAAPSANRFGRISPTTAQAVAEELGDRIDLILDGGPCQVGLESTVVSLGLDPAAPGELVLLRPGAVSRAQLEEATGLPVQLKRTDAPPAGTALAAPGMLASHYAPRKPLTLLPRPVSLLEKDEVQALCAAAGLGPNSSLGLLLLQGDARAQAARFSELSGYPVIARTLSAQGQLLEAAQNLFAELRALDNSPATALFAEPCRADLGIGHAIADRLRRASYKAR